MSNEGDNNTFCWEPACFILPFKGTHLQKCKMITKKKPGRTFFSGRVTSKLSFVPSRSQDQKFLQKLFCWRRCRSHIQRLISWKRGMLKWSGRHEEWILNAAWQTHCLLFRLWYTENTHTHTHIHWSATSSLLQSMKDEKPMSVRILILKSKVFWFWFYHNRAWSSLLSASLLAVGQGHICVWQSVHESPCVCAF